MAWEAGQSGNPNGRPPKNRALTEILAKQGGRTREDIDGKRRNGKRLVARLLWDVATTGETVFPGGKHLTVSPGDWFDVVKFLYAQIDGPPKTQLELSGDPNAPLILEYVNDWRPHHPTATAYGPEDGDAERAPVQLAGSGQAVEEDDAGSIAGG